MTTPFDTPETLANQPIQGPANPARPAGLAIGRMVHYVHPRRGKHYAAIVAEIGDREFGIVSLAVFDQDSRSTHYLDDVPHDHHGERRGSWHSIERED